ncbi:AraC-type DNA-binding protein [Paenibacillus sp. UNCCL117]|uniref:AraC family transcriptional regulator n=1 Tax=unclassified Paenibacillus TaxID=185978 RepID=UPI00088D1DBC|nr:MULTISPECIES: AraC family transcriptional regulator [unclassified Paenibacillus]SDE47444.1 AraC-type DNA-binding protein [Paenibacillus sp. cl123]SFW65702.1 AraC-type DNA-binding protein [Paenibacillus sp. UNCCL117]
MARMSVLLALPVARVLFSRGHSPEPLYQELELQEERMTHPDHYIEAGQFDRFLERAAQLCQDPHFGLRLGSGYSLDNLGLIGYILLNSSTLNQAFANFQRYNVLLCSGVVYDLQKVNGEARFSFWVSDPSRRPTYHLMESILASAYVIFQRLTGDRAKLKSVSFTHEPSPGMQPYADLFSVEPAFRQMDNMLVFDADALELPVLYRNEHLLQLVENHAIQTIRALKLEQTFSETVSLAIIRKFDGTIPRIQDIARSLGFSVRSMQLQLSKDHTTFKDLVAAIRKNMAESYLKNPSFSVTDISYALGFSDPASFRLAFKKWTGQTPGEFRKLHTDSGKG